MKVSYIYLDNQKLADPMRMHKGVKVLGTAVVAIVNKKIAKYQHLCPFAICKHNKSVENWLHCCPLNRVAWPSHAVITPRACARGKAIGFVCLSLLLSSRKSPDLEF